MSTARDCRKLFLTQACFQDHLVSLIRFTNRCKPSPSKAPFGSTPRYAALAGATGLTCRTAPLHNLPASGTPTARVCPSFPESMDLTPYMTELETAYLEQAMVGMGMAYETRRHSFRPASLIRRAYTCAVVGVIHLAEPIAVASDRCACRPRKATNAGQERACSSDIIGAGPPALTARAAQGAVSTVSEGISMQHCYKEGGPTTGGRRNCFPLACWRYSLALAPRVARRCLE